MPSVGIEGVVRPDMDFPVITDQPALVNWVLKRVQDPALYVLVSYVHVDARGDDVRAGGGEFVALTNVGANVVDLAGWTLRDAAGHTVTLPPNRFLGPGQRLRVRVAAGTDTTEEVFAGRGRAILNNRTGDRLELADASGRVVHVVSWEASK